MKSAGLIQTSTSMFYLQGACHRGHAVFVDTEEASHQRDINVKLRQSPYHSIKPFYVEMDWEKRHKRSPVLGL